jgi:hypothetical protein
MIAGAWGDGVTSPHLSEPIPCLRNYAEVELRLADGLPNDFFSGLLAIRSLIDRRSQHGAAPEGKQVMPLVSSRTNTSELPKTP